MTQHGTRCGPPVHVFTASENGYLAQVAAPRLVSVIAERVMGLEPTTVCLRILIRHVSGTTSQYSSVENYLMKSVFLGISDAVERGSAVHHP